MTEINCGACGSPNPSQSRYCNRCGAPLTSDTTQLCPTCDTPNPINLLYCDNCGTRLVDDSDEQDPPEDEDPRTESLSKPFSLPARPPGQTGNLDVSSDLPDWLVTGDFEDDDFQDLSEEEELRWLRAAQEGESWEDEGAPTLEELSGDHAPQDDLPTWLMDEESESAIFGGDKSTDELFMESLGSGEPDEGEEPEEDEPAPDESEAALGELENWLSEMEGDEAEPVAEDDETGEDIEETVPPPAEAEESDWPQDPPEEMSEDNFLQWLSEIDAEETDSAGESGDRPRGSTDVPDWLSDAIPGLEADVAGEEERAEDDDKTPDIADWPRAESEAGDELVAPAQKETEQAGDSETVEDNIPEDDFLQWLDSLDDAAPGIDSDEAALEALEDEQQPGSVLPVDELDPPEPLSNAPEAPETEADEAIAEFRKEDFDLPDWLGELSDVEGDAEGASLSDANELPSWLQDLAPPGGDARLPYVTGSEAEIAADAEGEAHGGEPGPESQAEAWLAEDDIQAGELPDWLDAARPEEGQMGEEQGEEHGFETSPESDADLLLEGDDIQEGELPDWLDGVTSELDATPPATGPDDERQVQEAAEQDEFALTEDSEQDFDAHIEDDLAEQVSAEDLPDWFSDVLADIETAEKEKAASDAASDRQNVPEQLAGSELPEWLDSPFSDDEETAEPTPIEEIPEWLRAPLQEKLAQAAAERGIDEASFEGGEEWRDLLEAPPSLTEHARGDAGRENAMAWLEEMRAKAPSDEDVESEPAPATDELDNPVSGISGAIDVAHGVTKPASARRQAEEADARQQEQQILLLRQMARGERVQTTEILPLATGMGALPKVARIVLSALLLAVALLGLFATDAVDGLVPQASGEPAMAPMEAVLSEAAGEPVLVVFDYTPAMAGALQPVAVEVLQALQERESYPLVTSQSAPGLALAAEAAGDAGLTEFGELGLVSGGALGVRQVGRCMRQGTQCQTLFGQPLAADAAGQLANVSTLVLVTGERDNMVAWIEQLEGNDSVALAAVVTPMLEPLAAPYRLSGQLAGVVIGNGGMTADSAAMNNNLSTALALSHWFAIVVIIAGALFYLVSDTVRSVRR